MTETPLLILSAASVAAAGIPAILFKRNLSAFLPPPDNGKEPRVSVLIPARNEENSIGPAVLSVLDDKCPDLEVVVMDDDSSDGTAAVVKTIAARDKRLRVVSAPPLPEGWSGKQNACAALAREARRDVFIFMDADVRLFPGAPGRMVSFLENTGADLAGGFPLEETKSFWEALIIPLIYFLLLGFLPLRWMRKYKHPAFAAGCGQLFIARRAAYEASGGHGNPLVKNSLHDGVTLPRAFRRAGFKTDVFDAVDVAVCRMYKNGSEVWKGFVKNAHEGLGAPKLIFPATILLLTGQILPILLLALMPWIPFPPDARLWTGCAVFFAFYPRLRAAARFRSSFLSAFLHPFGVAVLLTIQWTSFLRRIFRRPSGWKGRSYTPA